ncbi:MAG: chemotaxis protein CheA [Spirochaetia bacterium]|nr:chemotaxis protein CheA [Spirochaetia bacterium]
MNILNIRKKGYKIYKVIVNVDKSQKFPSLTGIDAFRLLNNKDNFGEPYEYLTCRPNIFNPAQKDEVDNTHEYHYYFASTLDLAPAADKLMKIKKPKNITAISIQPFSEDIIEQRERPRGTRDIDEKNETRYLGHEDVEKKETKSIRIDLDRIEEFGNLVGELIINKIQIESYVSEMLKEMNGRSKASANLASANKQLQLIAGKLRDLSLSIRMVPISSLFRKYPRILREITKKQNKKVRLIIQGEDTELDKAIIEKINDPLMHMIRNSIDHGIENEQERKKRKKDSMARLLIKAFYEGDRILVVVEDDGRGLDIQKIKKKAVEKNIISEEKALQLSEKEIMNLIFKPGFSTAENITNISGRGVGLDVVQNNITKLNGSVEVESKPGVGTRFILKLPLTLSIIQALLVREGKETYAIPLFSVHRTMKLEKSKIRSMGKYDVIEEKDGALPVFDLRNLLEVNADNERVEPFLIELTGAEGKFGLIVEKIMGQQEIVIKPLSEYIGHVDGLSGATILGDGSVTLILDVKAIGNKARFAIESTAKTG